MIKKVHGDIVECGVGRGRSLLIISAINYLLDKNEGGGRKVYGYDSFQGFPEPTMQDKSYRNPKKGEWSHSPSGKYKYTPIFIKKILDQAGLPENVPLTLKKGYFEKTLPHHSSKPIALLHVDCDLYQSYKTTLETLFDKVASGGVIVFDDLIAGDKNPGFPGAMQALRDFFQSEVKKLKISIAGKYYYIKK